MKTVGVSEKLVNRHKNKRHHVSKNTNLQSDKYKRNLTELNDTYCQQGKTGIKIC